MAATGSAGGPAMFAVTPDGERIDPDVDGVLHCSVEDTVVTVGGAGRGGVSAPLPDAVVSVHQPLVDRAVELAAAARDESRMSRVSVQAFAELADLVRDLAQAVAQR